MKKCLIDNSLIWNGLFSFQFLVLEIHLFVWSKRAAEKGLGTQRNDPQLLIKIWTDFNIFLCDLS